MALAKLCMGIEREMFYLKMRVMLETTPASAKQNK
jgi:hypothetical protein